MKLAFVSNFLNHHQLFLCNEFSRQCNEFYFIATERIPADRLELGYEDMNSKVPYVIRMYENKEERHKAYTIIKDFDAVIFGACSSELIEMRMKRNKLSFIYTERFLKNGLWHRYIPSSRKKIHNRVLKYNNKNLHVLCASAYASYDLALCGFKNLCYQWGYFTEVPNVNTKDLMNRKDPSHSKILWVGRFIKVKRTEDVIFLAQKLAKHKIDFTIDIIGSGKYERRLIMLVKQLGLTDKVHFLGSMAPEQVRKHMEEANIFLCTSNFAEGWGAVINEAMSSGCAVVTSHAVGSAPYLIEHRRNGLIYQSANINDLYRKVKKLIKYPRLQDLFGASAHDTMVKIWNPEVAARRFIKTAKRLLHGRNICYRKGPCSKAYIIKEDWYPFRDR